MPRQDFLTCKLAKSAYICPLRHHTGCLRSLARSKIEVISEVNFEGAYVHFELLLTWPEGTYVHFWTLEKTSYAKYENTTKIFGKYFGKYSQSLSEVLFPPFRIYFLIFKTLRFRVLRSLRELQEEVRRRLQGRPADALHCFKTLYEVLKSVRISIFP